VNKDEFIKKVYEIAFGDGAFYYEDSELRAFSFEEVLEMLREFSDNALKYTDPELFK
tara:strand:- start:1210 stop:1380 length:171 start_codon:yes stop_codon:yes gene_type:complete